MPIYEYEHDAPTPSNCPERFEILQRVDEPPLALGSAEQPPSRPPLGSLTGPAFGFSRPADSAECTKAPPTRSTNQRI
mgnify:CR=1 FL=1